MKIVPGADVTQMQPAGSTATKPGELSGRRASPVLVHAIAAGALAAGEAAGPAARAGNAQVLAMGVPPGTTAAGNDDG